MTSEQQASNMLQRIVGVFSRLTDSCRSSAQAQREPRLINVETPHGNLRFVATSDIEQWRATSLLHKEAGTVAWISRSVGPGDVFYDVGANIGIYSLLAALCAGPAGRVFAFEPHLLNCSSLLRNIASNNFGKRITPLCVALHENEQLLPFNYFSLTSGSSMSQLGRLKDGDDCEFTPEAVEFKQATSIDRLIEDAAILPPTHIKIDVDGNEPLILSGMRRLLAGSLAPREVQVEVNAGCIERIAAIMTDSGFECIERHDTAAGLERLRTGSDPATVAHNLIYRRRPQHPASQGIQHV